MDIEFPLSENPDVESSKFCCIGKSLVISDKSISGGLPLTLCGTGDKERRLEKLPLGDPESSSEESPMSEYADNLLLRLCCVVSPV